MKSLVLEKRPELIETVSEVDVELAEAFCSGNDISASDLDGAIRRATIARKFVPIFMGGARDPTGLRLLIYGVRRYLPSPIDVSNYALDQARNGEKFELSGSIDGPFVALAFKMKHRMLCKLTYLRIYQGVIRKGDFITNVNTGEKRKVTHLFKRSCDCIDEVNEAHAGQIVAVYDVDCAPGETFTDGSVRWAMTSANVPDYSVSKDSSEQSSNVVHGFQRNDPNYPVGLV
jgi:elongation factor G